MRSLYQMDWSVASSFSVSLALIALAEIGDKSQLVCLALARRGRPLAVFAGAGSAFALLNVLAVVFGNVVGDWFPWPIPELAVAILFAWFGIGLLRHPEGADDAQEALPSDSHQFRTAFISILIAEFGDKTQFAVAGLSVEYEPVLVWLGSTVALLLLTGLAVGVGNRLLSRVPTRLFHRVGGIVFLLLAAAATVSIFTQH